ncbi:MAG: hypothetical protein Q8M01_13570 [Rubrivivax sp.]|nr:hypothetical protein [Rubrivivax sp.]
MTTGSRPARFRIALTFQGRQGLILLDRTRALDRVRLVKRLGALRRPTLAATLQTLQAVFTMTPHDRAGGLDGRHVACPLQPATRHRHTQRSVEALPD